MEIHLEANVWKQEPQGQFGGAPTFQEQRGKMEPLKEREERQEENQEGAVLPGLWKERWAEGQGLASPDLNGLSLPCDCYLETPGRYRAQLLTLWSFLPTQHPLSFLGTAL